MERLVRIPHLEQFLQAVGGPDFVTDLEECTRGLTNAEIGGFMRIVMAISGPRPFTRSDAVATLRASGCQLSSTLERLEQAGLIFYEPE